MRWLKSPAASSRRVGLGRGLLACGIFWSLGFIGAVAQEAPVASDPALRQYNSASGLLARGLVELAEAEYRRFLADHAAHEKAALARYGLSVCLYRQKRYDDAVTALAPLASLPRFEFAAEVQAMLGQSHLAAQRYPQAAAAFEIVLQQHASCDLADDAAAGLVEAMYRLGRWEEAAQKAKAFEARWPDSPLRERAEYFAGLALIGKGDHAAAARQFVDFVGRYSNGPFTPQATLLAAQCLHRTDQVDAAVPLYERLLKSRDAACEADALLGLGRAMQQKGQADRAAQLLDQVLKKHSKSRVIPAARFYRGMVWFDQGKFDRARSQFEQVPADDGEFADDAAYWSAKCSLREGDFKDAARRLEQALAAFPESALRPEMTYDCAVALVQGADRESALPVLERFRKEFPDHALAPDTLVLSATLLHQLSRYDPSQSACREFMQRHAQHPSAAAVAFLLAENEFLAERLEAAEKGFRAFLERYPQDAQAAQARYRLGMVLYRMQRFAEAEPLLAQSAGEAGGKGSASDFHASRLALGDLAFQRGEWKTAEEHFRNFLANGADLPGTEDALLKLGLSLQRQARHEDAMRIYDDLLRGFDKGRHGLQAQFEKGQCLVALDRREEAAKLFEHVADKGGAAPLVAYALQHLGAIASRRGDHGQAAEWFRRSGEAASDDALKASAAYQQGQALFACGQYDQAERVLAEFLKRYAEHELAAQAAAQRAMALGRANRTREALAAMDRALKEHAARLDPATRQALLYDRAWCLRAERRNDDAVQAYERMLSDSASGALAAHALLEAAELDVEAGRFEAALPRLREVVQRGRSDPASVPADVAEPALYRLGICEFQLQHHAEAADALQPLIERFPQSKLMPSALYFCGEANLKLGRHDLAVRHLSRLVESFAQDEACAAGLLRLGEALAALGRWNKSEQAFADYLDRYKDGAQRYQALFGVGWARENQHRHDEAIAAYRQVVDMHPGPTAARAQFQIGECLFAQNKLDDAVREFLKVDILYAYPEWSAAALYEAGQCFEKLGKPAEAREQFKTVTQKFADTKWAKLATQRLGSEPPAVASGREE